MGDKITENNAKQTHGELTNWKKRDTKWARTILFFLFCISLTIFQAKKKTPGCCLAVHYNHNAVLNNYERTQTDHRNTIRPQKAWKSVWNGTQNGFKKKMTTKGTKRVKKKKRRRIYTSMLTWQKWQILTIIRCKQKPKEKKNMFVLIGWFEFSRPKTSY